MVLLHRNGKLEKSFISLLSVTVRKLSKKSIVTEKFLADISSVPLFPDEKVDQTTSDNVYSVSVGTVINKTMSAESLAILARWQQRKKNELGFIGYSEYITNIKRVGFEMHNVISQYFYKNSHHTELTVPQHLEKYFNSLYPVLKEVQEPICVEKNIRHPLLNYQGRMDGIIKIDGVNWLVEWKTIHEMRRVTSIKESYDAPLQLAAYLAAYNSLQDPSDHITRGLLVYAYPTGEPADVVPLTGKNLDSAWQSWLIRLTEYFKLVKQEQEKNSQQIDTDQKSLKAR